MQVLCVKRREVLREAFAEPLLVIVLPAHRLPPPLMGGFVRDEKFRELVEVRRIVAPRDWPGGRGLAERREVGRAVAAGRASLHTASENVWYAHVVHDAPVELHRVLRYQRELEGAALEQAARLHRNIRLEVGDAGRADRVLRRLRKFHGRFIDVDKFADGPGEIPTGCVALYLYSFQARVRSRTIFGHPSSSAPLPTLE
jgi:hypothetical protein